MFRLKKYRGTDAEIISRKEQIEDSVTSCRNHQSDGRTAKKVDDQPLPLVLYRHT